MQIHELPTISGSPSGGYFATDNGTQTTKIDYTALAQAIIEQYNASTLAGTAQSVKAALDGLDGNKLDLKSGTAITNSTDVNTLQTPGTYFCSSASIAASLSNIPTQAATVGFRMDVARNGYNADNYLTQTLRAVSSGAAFEYVRGMSTEGTWGAWQKVPTRAEIDSILKPYKVGGSTPDIDDCNSLPRNSIGYTYASALNSPDSGYQIFTYGLNDSNKVQLALRGTVNPRIKTRLLTGGNWSAWVESAKQTEVDALSSNMASITFTRMIATTSGTTATLPNNYRGILKTIDSAADRCGLYFVRTASNGSVNCTPVREATALTIDSSTANKLTVTSPGSSVCIFENISGTVTV